MSFTTLRNCLGQRLVPPSWSFPTQWERKKESLALSCRLPSCCGVKEKIIVDLLGLGCGLKQKKKNRKKQHLNNGHLRSKSQTKKVKKNSVLGSTPSNPRTAKSVSGQSQHHCPSTYLYPASLFHQVQSLTRYMYHPCHHHSWAIRSLVLRLLMCTMQHQCCIISL